MFAALMAFRYNLVPGMALDLLCLLHSSLVPDISSTRLEAFASANLTSKLRVAPSANLKSKWVLSAQQLVTRQVHERLSML